MKSNTLRYHDGDVPFYSFPAFDETGMVSHGISTRFGGVSQGDFATMNFSVKVGDKPEAVLENYTRFCNAIGTDVNKAVASMQTHTTNLRIVTEDDQGSGVTRPHDYTDIDGLITDRKGVTLVIHTADCVPIAFLDTKKEVIGLAHAGWRGTVNGIAVKVIESMKEHFGSEPKDILCGIAPSICRDCFEVDEPVAEIFANQDVLQKDAVIRKRSGVKYDIDLWEANREFLLSAGILPEHITVTDLCTKCHPDVFHSHRATGGKRGVIAVFLALK